MPPKKKAPAKAPAKTQQKQKFIPRTQRKINHVLDHVGSGDTFHYLKSFNPLTGFEAGQEVIFTEKWDGTTVQATNQAIFKRIDKIQKGDTRKHSANEEQRYNLEELDLDNPKNKYIAKAVANYLDTFKQLEEGECVYFEALGTLIGSRFQHIKDFYDIKVFDFSRNGNFLSFEETIELAEKYNLPITNSFTEKLDIDRVIQRLSDPTCYDDADAQLEGFVIREAGYDLLDGGKIGKFRVDDVPKIKVQSE